MRHGLARRLEEWSRAREGDRESLAEILERHLTRIQMEIESTRRAQLLRELARLCEDEFRDPARAFTLLIAAPHEEPRRAAWNHLERLAVLCDGWSELVVELSRAVPELPP